MVAGHRTGVALPQPVDDRVGIGPVPDDVPEHPELVHRADGVEDSVEGRHVRMDVGKHGHAHRRGA